VAGMLSYIPLLGGVGSCTPTRLTVMEGAPHYGTLGSTCAADQLYCSLGIIGGYRLISFVV